MRLQKFAMFAALLLLVLEAGVVAAPLDAKGMRLLGYDDGKMDERVRLNLSGATVEFVADAPSELTGVQFFGSRYSNDATPLESFIVTISDESFRPLRRMDKPITNISPGHDTWQTVAIEPEIAVSGKFYVTLIHDSTPTKGIFLGADTTSAGDRSKTGAPGTVATTVDPNVNYMIRALTAPPGTVAAARAAKPVRVVRPAVATKPRVAAPPAKKAPAKPAVKPALTPFSRPSASAQIAYRDPNRRLSMRSKAPSLPRGSGRVDVSWDVAPPVSVTLQYAGYGPKKPPVSAGVFNARRIVVDFPVPEPAQFSVVVEKSGFQPATKVFRVVRGSSQQWRAALKQGTGAGAPEPVLNPAEAEPDSTPALPANPLPSSADPGRNATGFGGNMSSPDEPALEPGNEPVVPSIDAPAPLPSVNDPAVRSNTPRRAPRDSRMAPGNGVNAPSDRAPGGTNRRLRPRPNMTPPGAPGQPPAGEAAPERSRGSRGDDSGASAPPPPAM